MRLSLYWGGGGLLAQNLEPSEQICEFHASTFPCVQAWILAGCWLVNSGIAFVVVSPLYGATVVCELCLGILY